MVLKTFNLDEKTYKKFSRYCRERGISMSKQVDLFIKAQLEIIREEEKKIQNKIGIKRKDKIIRVSENNVVRTSEFAQRHLS